MKNQIQKLAISLTPTYRSPQGVHYFARPSTSERPPSRALTAAANVPRPVPHPARSFLTTRMHVACETAVI